MASQKILELYVYVDFLKERKAVEEAVDAAYAPVTE